MQINFAIKLILMQLSFTQKKHIRKNFGKLVEGLSIPNLIEVQKNSYNEFLSSKSLKDQLSDLSKGIDKVFKVFFLLKMEMINQHWNIFHINLKNLNLM